MNINFTWLLIWWMSCVPVESIHLWVGSGTWVSHQSMSIAKCSGKTSIRKTMKQYVMACLHQFIVFFLESKLHFYPLKDRKLCKTTVTGIWLLIEFPLEWYVAPKLLISYLIYYWTSYYFKRWHIKPVSMVFLRHCSKQRRILGLLFPFPLECARLKISNKKKMK